MLEQCDGWDVSCWLPCVKSRSDEVPFVVFNFAIFKYLYYHATYFEVHGHDRNIKVTRIFEISRHFMSGVSGCKLARCETCSHIFEIRCVSCQFTVALVLLLASLVAGISFSIHRLFLEVFRLLMQ